MLIQENLDLDAMSLKECLPANKLLRRRVPGNWEQTVTAEISIDKESRVERIFQGQIIWFKEFEIILCLVRGSTIQRKIL